MYEQTQHMQDGSGGTLSVERLLYAVRRRLKLVIIMPVLAAALSTAYALSLPSRYDASAFVQIDPRQKSISNLQGIMADLQPDAATVESEVEIIRSKLVILKVIDILNLRSDPEFSQPPVWVQLLNRAGILASNAPPQEAPRQEPVESVNTDPITGILGPAKPGQTRPTRDALAAVFADRLGVWRVRNTLLLEIRFTSESASKAAKIANTVAEVYLAEQLKQKQEVADHASQVLKHQLAGLRRSVSEAERRVAEFKSANDIFDSEGQILGEKQLARLMEQTVMARNTTAEARAKFEMAERISKSGQDIGEIAEVLQSDTVRLLKEKVARATGQEAELATRYGPRHPEMQKIRAEVADAQSQLAREVRQLVSNLKNELQVAEHRERTLNASLAALKSDDTVSKTAGVRLNELVREADSSKMLYESLLARYKQTVGTQKLQLPDSRIVEQADTPLSPAGPRRGRIITLATFGGGVLGLAVAILIEFLTFGIGRPEDVEQVFELAHLASLPALDHDQQPGVALHDMRLMVAQPSGSFAEAIRALRREVDVRRAHEGSRIIQVASSLPGEGGGIVASNLALHYAMTGTRVLLIDADMRRAHLTRELAKTRHVGFADAISRGVPVEQAILFDGATGMHFLPATGSAPTLVAPAEIASSRTTTETLNRLKSQFEVIVMDAPPLLPVIDARILADQSDQIVFVMSWRSTPKQLARRALSSLGYNQGKLVGVVVNQVDEDLLSDQIGHLDDTRPPGGWTGFALRQRAA
ncbi:MAG: AAA family ATPase [Hyphomicrobiaceae bacterium]|nr:AAA family ATPase [Hyphomicrobiaceae bacterium]MCC0011043.1 AAA family ATPase [Hyphomicrobiaceae bacterium]